MKWIIGIFIILDVIYQSIGIIGDTTWMKYYDFIHYAGLFSMGLYYAYEKKSFLIAILSGYFGFVTGNIIFQVGLTRAEYLDSIKQSYILYCIIAMALLIIFIIYKSWPNLKKTG